MNSIADRKSLWVYQIGPEILANALYQTVSLSSVNSKPVH